MLPSRRSSSEMAKVTPTSKPRRSVKNQADLFKDGLPAAPTRCFTQTCDQKLVNNFRIGQKLEAQDPRNPTAICLATVISLQGPRILLRLDGNDKCNDFWRLVDSGDIYMLGTHEDSGNLLTPPLGYTKNVSTWSTFLAKNRVKGEKAEEECFLPEPVPPDYNLFQLGMKLEAVDKKNPDLICPATIGDVKMDQVFISFDGWRGAIDYWCPYNSRDIFPVGWCSQNDHPLINPGNKGDNPAVVARLEKLFEESKRQTRSGAINQNDSGKNSEPTTPQTKSSGQPRGRTRLPRSLTPVPRRSRLADKTVSLREDASTRSDEDKITSSRDFTDDESMDSLTSSQTSSETESSENEIEIIKTSSVSQSQESSDDDKSLPQDDARNTARKLLKRLKKQKKKLRKLAEKSADSGDFGLYKRKRYKSTGDEENLILRKKMTKKRQMRSISVMYDSTTKNRMMGFGKSPPNQNQHSSGKSPSFLHNLPTPTSLFGVNKEDIVKKATTGWPSGFLIGGPEKVVTSDNKLGRFSGASPNHDQMDSQSDPTSLGQVTTTTKDMEDDKAVNLSPQNSSMETSSIRIDGVRSISSHMVSSTTRSISPPERGPPPLIPLNLSHQEISEPPAKPRSTNPQRWTVSDVMNYIQEKEPALGKYTHLFKIHEIDGQALLLLNSEIAVKYMNMKLGPALKLANLVEKIKRLVPQQRNAI